MAEMRIGMRRGVPIAELIIDRRRGRILDPIERPPLRLDQRGDLPFVAMPDDAIAFVASRLRLFAIHRQRLRPPRGAEADVRGIGRASCRARVCQYVEIWVVAVTVK